MLEISINYDPVIWAKEFHSSNIKHCCLAGGLGSGKTTAAIRELQALAIENPGFTYVIARKTMPSLRDTTMKQFNATMEQGLMKSENKTHSVWTMVNGTEFWFRPLDDKEKLKSMEIAGFFIDEANEIDRDTYEIFKSRVRQKINGKEPTMYRTIISLNPGEEDHWIPTLFLHEKPKDHKMFQSTTMDNLLNLPENYIEELKATFSPDMQQRMIHGLFGRVHKGRPVFPQFSRGNYVKPIEYDPKKPLIRGFDFGFNRPACVWLQMHNMQIRVLAEMLGKDVYLQDFIKNEIIPYELSLFGKQSLKTIDFCDPRGSDESDKGKTSVQILNEHGIYPAYRRTWIEEGIKVVKERMDTLDADTQEPNFLVHPRCKNAIEGFRGGYAREDGEEKPRKDDYYDHIQDAIRYATLHSVQRARISSLNRDAQASRVYTNPRTGHRVEF